MVINCAYLTTFWGTKLHAHQMRNVNIKCNRDLKETWNWGLMGIDRVCSCVEREREKERKIRTHAGGNLVSYMNDVCSCSFWLVCAKSFLLLRHFSIPKRSLSTKFSKYPTFKKDSQSILYVMWWEILELSQ